MTPKWNLYVRIKTINEQDNIMNCLSAADKFPRNETVYFLLRIGIGKHMRGN
jgi:hypothetical protein